MSINNEKIQYDGTPKWGYSNPSKTFLSRKSNRVSLHSLSNRTRIKGIDDIIRDVYGGLSLRHENSRDICMIGQQSSYNGFSMDYHKEIVQQIYLLRYVYAYAYEYKSMLDEALCDLSLRRKKSVWIDSLGCGSQIDCWAINVLLNSRNYGFEFVHYNGVDKIKWVNDFGKETPMLEKLFFHENVCDYISNKLYLDSDIIIFPRSISDFSEAEFNFLCEQFSKKDIAEDTIYLLVSRRVKDNRKVDVRDDIRIQKIINAFDKNSFYLLDQLTYNEIDQDISFADKTFHYPNELLNGYRINLSCSNRGKEKLCGNCVLDRAIMLSTRNIKYKIFKLTRRDRYDY